MAEAAILPPDVMMDADDEDAEDYRWKKDVVNSFELGSMPCSNCMKKYLGTGFLNCRHFLCSECIDQSRNANNTLNCPVSTCCFDGQNAVVEDVLAPMVPRRSGGKAMEDDLLYDPPLDEGPYKNLLWFQGMMKQKWLDYHSQAEHKRSHPMDGPHDDLKGSAAKRMAADPDKTTQAEPQAEKPLAKPAVDPLPVEVNDTVENIIEVLCKQVYGHDYILGFYPCPDTDKVVLDIKEDHKEATDNFIRENIEPHVKNAREFLEIAPQENTAILAVSSGDKVANVGDREEGQHQDTLQEEYGTIACLAMATNHPRDPDSKMYAITTRHTFDIKYEQECEIEEPVMSSIQRELRVIGDRHIGHRGIIRADNDSVQAIRNTEEARAQPHLNRAVDIAAVPLRPAIVAMLDESMLHDLQPYYRSPDVHAIQLKRQIVTKNGAQSGQTRGKVTSTRYYGHYDQWIQGQYLAISPNDHNGSFAREGDSGSLVWSNENVPIGIIARVFPGHNRQGNRTNISLAVRLDNNIDVLRKCGVVVEKLITYGAPLPVIPGERPGNDMQTDDVEQMQV